MAPVPADSDTCGDADEWKWQRRSVFSTGEKEELGAVHQQDVSLMEKVMLAFRFPRAKFPDRS